jgi:hypothetical protein
MTDFAQRTDPAVFRPLIHQELLRIARAVDADEAALARKLTALSARGHAVGRTQWEYLLSALDVARPHLWNDTTRERFAGDWFGYFLEGRHKKYVPHRLVLDTDEDGDGGGHAVFLESHDEIARPCLRQERFVGGYDADVVALWRRKGGYESVCHSHPEGFWLLGRDAAEFAQ